MEKPLLAPLTNDQKELMHLKQVKRYLKLIGIIPPYKTSAMVGKLTRAQIIYLRSKFDVTEDYPMRKIQSSLLFPIDDPCP